MEVSQQVQPSLLSQLLSQKASQKVQPSLLSQEARITVAFSPMSP
jgi:hypothetical protein